MPIVEAGQNRQLASWRFFVQAGAATTPACTLLLDGYQLIGRPAASGDLWSIVDIVPIAPTPSPQTR